MRDRLPLLRHLIAVDDGDGTTPPTDAVAYEDALAAASPERDFGPRSDDDLYILYTGGTTGYPKGVDVAARGRVADARRRHRLRQTGERIEDEHEMTPASPARPSPPSGSCSRR